MNGEAKLSNPSKSSWGRGLVSKQISRAGSDDSAQGGLLGPIGAIGIAIRLANRRPERCSPTRPSPDVEVSEDERNGGSCSQMMGGHQLVIPRLLYSFAKTNLQLWMNGLILEHAMTAVRYAAAVAL